jgi:hypothetical protein
MTKLPFHITALAVVLTASISVSAQSGRGSMSGYVTSRVGNGGVPKVKIEIEPIETISSRATSRTAVTDDNGLYEMLQVTMGEYLLKISAEGYETYQTKMFIPSDGHLMWGTLLHKKKE